MSITLTPPATRPEQPLHHEMAGSAPPPSDEVARNGHNWTRIALVVLLALTAAAYLWNLDASGYANSFYSAAVEAGTKSWKAFLFGSIDSSNFITVDKPPGSLWLMELSGRLFGFSSWSMLAPEALAGVASVGILYATVKRWFGATAGLIAGVALATTPVAALMFRFNNPDALLVLVLVASAYTLVRALERGATRWIVATGALIGFAFLVKMLQAFAVLPAFYLAYLFAAPGTWWRRVRQLAICSGAVAIAAGWWVALVALWPASSRPMIDGSSNNSIINLILEYNGLGRLTGSSTGQGANFSGSAGIFRLFNNLMGGQAAWLIPAALLVVVAGVIGTRRAPRTDRTRAALVIWGGWLLVTGAIFSLSKGTIHTYYTVALAPAVAALFGIGAGWAWTHRSQLEARLAAAIAIVATALTSAMLLDRTPTFVPWLRTTILVAGGLSAFAICSIALLPRLRRPIGAGAAALALIACVAGPIAYSASTITTAHNGSVPSAGPTSSLTSAGIGPSGGGGFGSGGFGSGSGGSGATPPSGSGASGGGLPGSSTGSTTSGGTRPTGGFPGTGSSGGPGGGSISTSSALIAALKSDASSYRWVAATFGSQSAATLELSTGGAPVMAIGGFSGQSGDLTLAQFESYVEHHEIHYFIASEGSGIGGRSSSESAITAWVESHYSAKTIGGETVYDLSGATK